jgi:methanogenic corrinoid protein MtbC1
VIRAWERRYGAIVPSRSGTNRRFYTDEDVERLILLRQATLSGRQIGQIGNLSTEELKKLVTIDQEAIANAPRLARPREKRSENGSLLAASLAAVEDLDAQELQYLLERAMVELSPQKVIEDMIVPLLVEIGDRWEHGTMRVNHEHMASAVIGSLLTNIQATALAADNAPPILVASPVRQFHELGGLMASAAAAAEGWKVTYLGSNLPAEEIAAAALQKGVGVIALSIVYPADDPHLERELTRLRRLIGDGPQVIVGGRAASSYRSALETISAHLVEDISNFRMTLRSLRY